MSPKPRALSFSREKNKLYYGKATVSSDGRALVKTRGHEFDSRTETFLFNFYHIHER